MDALFLAMQHLRWSEEMAVCGVPNHLYDKWPGAAERSPIRRLYPCEMLHSLDSRIRLT
jgi:hypothetical protein